MANVQLTSSCQKKAMFVRNAAKKRQTWIIEEVRAATGQPGGPEITLAKEGYQS
jgi:hypothetical protein